MQPQYRPADIEKQAQAEWEETGAARAVEDPARPKIVPPAHWYAPPARRPDDRVAPEAGATPAT